MRILAFLVLSLAASSAFALPTLEDVEHAVHRGDYSAAETMTREVVTARPNSAKAHYILAEILAHEGKTAEARTQAASARQLDPEIHFTAPDKFRQFEAQLGGRSSSAPAATTAKRDAASRRSADDSGGFSMSWVVLLLLGAGVVFFLMRRRPDAPPNYGNNYPTSPNGMPGAPGGYGAPGYPGYGPVPPQGSGMGGRVAAGLGGIAAGMVAEHMIEEALGNHRAQASELPSDHLSQGQQSLEDRPIDFGNGNDWGGDAGGGDSGGGFDSGGSSDWS